MELFKVSGGKRLDGEIKLHGAKNSALPILAATILVKGESVIHNCPDLSDVRETLKILEDLGCTVKYSDSTACIDATNINKSTISEQTMRSMRSSILFLSALISRTGSASIFYPGGCEIGTRPVDLHFSALKALGAVVCVNGSSINCTAGRIRGAKIILPFPSVGATENIIIASAISKGRTTIINPAREPEISDLADYLNHCGARIYGAGETTIEIDGVDSLYPCCHTIIPDRILASTYMSACAITGSSIQINNIRPTHLSPIFPVFNEMGCKLYLNGSTLKIEAPKRLKRVRTIKTMPFPGFPTDSQSPVISALSISRGTSVLQENIFENRFRYISELNRFGADIEVDGKFAIINGVKSLHPANVNATDLRGGAAMVVAALSANGESTINYIHHIDRGYECLENSLASIGADIKRISYEKKEKKTNKSRKRTSPVERDLIDIGLEPPKIYRDNQERNSTRGTQRQRRDNQNLTRSEKRARETKKRKKRNRLRSVFIWTVAVIVFLAIGVVLSLTMFFNINNVTVEGNKMYSAEEILSQCTIDKGENLFMSDTNKAKKTIEQNLPYVYNAEIKRKLPDTIQINITEAKPAYSIKCKDKTYILLDNRFKVLEVGSQVSKGIRISKAEVKSAVPGKPIEFKNADVGECLKMLGDTVKKGDFSEITAIYSNNISDNYVVYQDRIEFKLGNCDKLDTKIYQGLAACEQLNESSPNVSGTMTISGDKSVYFTEE